MRILLTVLILISVNAHARDKAMVREANHAAQSTCQWIGISQVGQEIKKGVYQIQLDRDATQFAVAIMPNQTTVSLNGVIGYRIRPVAPEFFTLKSGYLLKITTFQECGE